MLLRVLTVSTVLIFATSAFGQGRNNLVDVSGGYSVSRSEGTTANGWYGDVGIRAFRSFYIVGGLSAGYFSETAVVNGNSVTLDASGYGVGAGPRVFLTRKHPIISPFVDTFLSFQHTSADIGSLGGSVGSVSVNGFGLDFGGGSDFRINNTFSVRVRPGFGVARAQGETSHGFGLQAGVVLHVGPRD